MVSTSPNGRWLVPCLLLTLGLLTTSGCLSGGFRTVSSAEFDQLLRDRGVEEVIVPFRISEEMYEWVARTIPTDPREDRKLSFLADALLSPSGLEIAYERDANLTAQEVFAERRANCLAFTQLFIGLARSVGIEAYFLQVRDVERFEREGDLVILSDHVAVGFGPTHDMRIIDFGQAQAEYQSLQILSDFTAVALFYSNLGTDALRIGDTAGAARWLEQAVKIDPDLPDAWVNLGVVHRRSGDPVAAERSYRRALEADPGASSAYNNLAALLRMQGKEAEASELLELAAVQNSRNPFAYTALAEYNARHGRSDEAMKFFRRAVQLGEDQPDVLAAYGLFRLSQGERRAAERLLRRARKMDSTASRVVLLERRLSGSG
ncbi:MAG: tetratricopeptide repeat protein [Acidobacteriota bacterium]